jgi:dipeptidase E
MRVAQVTTASKVKNNKEYVVKDRNRLIEAGFIVEEYDIEGKSKSEVLADLSSFDIIYVQGGNTFYLLEAMHKVDFANIIRQLLDQGVIYIGESAAACVAGPDIKPALWLTNDNEKVGLKDLTGLFLVNFGVIPHFTGKLPESVGKEVMKAPYDVKYLRDDQLIYINGKEDSEITAK